jgi:outer membrane protein OmpA-like peptidoglycan-associated protein
VEIVASSDNILQPIIHERFNEYSFQPRAIPLALDAYSPTGINTWQLRVKAASEYVWEQTGTGTPPQELAWKIDDDLADRIGELIERKDSLHCELTVTDGHGGTAVTEHLIPASKALHPYEVSRLSLIVFDFDKADISAQNQRMVSTFIARSLLPTSTASIIGSTDRLGELDHNQQLSQARAISVRDLIGTLRSDATITEAKGVGPSRLLYDNDLPEGRYYCRTVSVEVQTPIEDLQPIGEASPTPAKDGTRQ